MRVFVSIFLGLTLCTGVFATEYAPPTSVMEGYKEYTKALEAGEESVALFYAKSTYELAEDNSKSSEKLKATLALNWLHAWLGKSSERMHPSNRVVKSALTYFENDEATSDEDLVLYYTQYSAYRMKYRGTQNPDFSLVYFNKALKLLQSAYGKDSTQEANLRYNFGTLLYNGGNTRADKMFKKARAIYAQDAQKNKSDLAVVDFWLGKTALQKSKMTAAKGKFLAAIDTMERDFPDSSLLMTAHAFMVEILERQGKREEATKHCRAIGRSTPQGMGEDYRPIFLKHPEYPRSLQEQGKEGSVVVEMDISEDGFVQNPRILEREGSRGFEKVALETIKQFRYAPHFKGDAPQLTQNVKYRFTFDLKD